MRTKMPTPELIACVNDLKGVLGRHSELTAMEMLAATSQLVGNLVALQDQRSVTPAMAMELVAQNIEIGNQAVIEGLSDTKGSA